MRTEVGCSRAIKNGQCDDVSNVNAVLDSEKESQMSNQAIPSLTNWIKEFEDDTRNAVPVVPNTNCV